MKAGSLLSHRESRAEAAMLGLFSLALAATAWGVRATRFPDSATYLEFNRIRLPAVPALYWLLPNDGARVAAQVTLAVVAWGLLALAIRRSVTKGWLAWAGMATVLVFPLTPAIAEWNVAILSESVTISLTIATAAIWWWWLRRRDPRWLVAATAVTIAFVFTRHLHIPVGIAIVVALVWLARRAEDARARRVAAAILFMGCVVSSGLALREREVARSNAMSIIADRIALQPSAMDYFREHGLPRFTPIQQRYRGDYLGNEELFLGDNRLVRWVDDHFLSTYSTFLLRHPRELVVAPVEEAPDVVAKPARYSKVRTVLPERSNRVLYGWRTLQALLVLTLIVIVITMFRRALRWSSPLVVGTAGVVVGLFWSLLVYLLSANELPRLGVPGGVLLRVALLLMLVGSIDRLIMRDSVSDGG